MPTPPYPSRLSSSSFWSARQQRPARDWLLLLPRPRLLLPQLLPLPPLLLLLLLARPKGQQPMNQPPPLYGRNSTI